MRIAIDLMGGDNAPAAVAEGCALALQKLSEDTELVIFGEESAAKALIEEYELDMFDVRFVATTQQIGCDESPTLAIRKKKDSSLVRAVESVASGETDCVISAGSTGALLAGATFLVKRIDGVKRPALAVVLPTVTGGQTVLLDSGANTDCKPQYLQQFALMGAAYAEKVLRIELPRVGLLNNGAEAEKGNELTKAAYALLRNTPVNFVGNCEARDALSGEFDVIVADGFDGNVLLKSIEGTAAMMMQTLKTGLYASARTKLGALLAKPAFRALKKKLDYTEAGGAPLLGVRGGVIKAHGSSNAKAFCSAILQAERLVNGNVQPIIAESVAALPAED